MHRIYIGAAQAKYDSWVIGKFVKIRKLVCELIITKAVNHHKVQLRMFGITFNEATVLENRQITCFILDFIPGARINDYTQCTGQCKIDYMVTCKNIIRSSITNIPFIS